MTIQAEGPLSWAYQGLAKLIAACPNFQTAIGASDAAEALARIHYPKVKLTSQDGDDVIAERPWCLITMDQTCEWNYDFATQRANGDLIVSFELPIASDIDEDSDDALKAFANLIGLIFVDMGNLKSTPANDGSWYWNVTTSVTVQPPAVCTYSEDPNPDPDELFYAASFKISWV